MPTSSTTRTRGSGPRVAESQVGRPAGVQGRGCSWRRRDRTRPIWLYGVRAWWCHAELDGAVADALGGDAHAQGPLRQSERLRTALSARRDLPTTVGADDAERRAVFTRALGHVVVLPHPTGQAASHLTWEQRSALLEQRLRIVWADTA